MSEDEISIEMGVDPRTAAELAMTLQQGHNAVELRSSAALPPPPAIAPSGGSNPEAQGSGKGGGNKAKGEKTNNEPPQKKARPQKPQAG